MLFEEASEHYRVCCDEVRIDISIPREPLRASEGAKKLDTTEVQLCLAAAVEIQYALGLLQLRKRLFTQGLADTGTMMWPKGSRLNHQPPTSASRMGWTKVARSRPGDISEHLPQGHPDVK